MATLELRNLTKRYGSVKVLEDLSLTIAAGEFVVLVGPSGCGKSTLLRMIAGLEEIDGGDLIIGDRRANDIPPQNRDISMVFQSYALFPHLTVRRNITFGPEVRGETLAETERRLALASEVLNLTDQLDKLPGQLSGGQRQRVAMGRAIVRDPTVFLFDEPLSNLDAKLRVQMRTEIKALHQKLGTTIVYVTHDQIEAMTMGDRIVVMNGGRIEQEGAPLDLYDRPANIFVAGFIGSPAMGFLDAILGEDGTAALTNGGGRLRTAAPAAAAGRAVKLGFRPEAFRRDAEGPLALHVEVVEPTGPEIHLYGQLAGGPIRAVFRDRFATRPGDAIPVSVHPADVHIFDAATGVRLGP